MTAQASTNWDIGSDIKNFSHLQGDEMNFTFAGSYSIALESLGAFCKFKKAEVRA